MECFPNQTRELDAYLLHIIELANSYTGRAYWQYHTAFAKKQPTCGLMWLGLIELL